MAKNSSQPKNGWEEFFLRLCYLGFANCQLIMYISNVGEHHRPHGTYNYSNEYVFGFANGQPISYIEDVS